MTTVLRGLDRLNSVLSVHSVQDQRSLCAQPDHWPQDVAFGLVVAAMRVSHAEVDVLVAAIPVYYAQEGLGVSDQDASECDACRAVHQQIGRRGDAHQEARRRFHYLESEYRIT